MAITNNVTQSIYQNTADTAAVILGVGDTLNLMDYAGIFANGTGISPGIAASTGCFINLSGDVFSRNSTGISTSGGGHAISIASTSSVFGYNLGIYLAAGGNTITNFGDISSASNAALAVLGPTGANIVNNVGHIRAPGNAIYLEGNGNAVNNAGYVESGTFGYAVNLGGSGTVTNSGYFRGGAGIFAIAGSTVNNSGSIVALNAFSAAFAGSNQTNTVTNTGLMQGGQNTAAVVLNGGNDIYDGRGGTLVGAVQGGDGNDFLYGGAGAETLQGDGDNDYISGGGGADTLDGGTGYDFARYDFATAGLTVGLNNNSSNTGEAAGDTLLNFEGLIGSQFADILVGNGSATGNQIYGMGGNDTIYGLAGNDYMIGGSGNDTYYVDASADAISEETQPGNGIDAGGNDLVISSADFALANFVEGLVLSGAAVYGTGNGIGNTITGNAGVNIINGRAGSDTLTGGGDVDYFQFFATPSTGFGVDYITDFVAGSAAGHDVIQFSSSLFANHAAVMAASSQQGSSVMIQYDANNTVILLNTTLANLVAADFQFV